MTNATIPASTAADLAVGESAVVQRVVGAGPLRRRLLELGLLPGTPIRVMRRAPLGDPVELRVRGGSLSIRRQDAASILVHRATGRRVP